MNATRFPQVEGRMRLRDGRLLAWAEFGDPTGLPVLYFHGTPGSRLEGGVFARAALRERIRIIAPDRPGYGASTYLPGRLLGDWPADVDALGHFLGLGRAAVLGYSGGGPHALAAALLLPDWIRVAGLIASPGPTGRVEAVWEALSTAISVSVLWAFMRTPRVGYAALTRGIRVLSPSTSRANSRDRSQEGEAARILSASVREGVRFGVRGTLRDSSVITGPWLEEVWAARAAITPAPAEPPPLVLWHGARDRVVPPRASRDLARAVVSVRLTEWADETHLSILTRRTRDILAGLRRAHDDA